MTPIKIKWRKQPRQMTFLRACGLDHPFTGGKPGKAAAKVIGYGGAAGGGKSDALLMAGIIGCLTYARCNVGFFRRKFTQLQGPGGAIQRSHEILSGLGVAKWQEQKHRWVFFNDAILQFCHMEYEKNKYDYQSQQFDIVLFDEGTHFTRDMYRYMATRNRATSDIPRPFMAVGTNPGGVGHTWFKAEFVEAGEPEKVHLVEVEPGRFEEHMFIPAKLSDNKALTERDPEYEKNLDNQPEHIRRQLKDGDWDIAEGMAFSEWRKQYHVCEPFEIPDEWIRFRSMDWGFAKPYSIGWYAVDFDGRLYKYRELYGYGGEADAGTREDPEEVAMRICEIEHGREENIRFAVADDAIFGGKQDNSKSIAEQFAEAFMKYDRKNGTRTTHWTPVGKGPRSRIQGKLEFHHRLKIPVDKNGEPTGERPMIVFFDTCTHSIRTIPNLIVDENDPEDIDTTQEDHAYDETRYACMSRPMTSKPKPKEKSLIRKHKESLAKKRNTYLRRVL